GGRVFGGQAGHGGNSSGDHATISGNGERLAPNLGARRRWFCWRRAVGGEGYSEKLVLKGSCIVETAAIDTDNIHPAIVNRIGDHCAPSISEHAQTRSQIRP